MRILPCLVLLALVCPAVTLAQVTDSPAEIYGAWCARCHGADGSGTVAVPTVKTQPPDFRDCRISTGEPTLDWQLVITQGGPATGLSSEMPAFGPALKENQILGLIAYIREFCGKPGWPSGDLNFARPIFTEKAFPEDELVILPWVSHRKGEADTAVSLRAVYERRFGSRAHGEIGFPFESVGALGTRESGLGDLELAGKYVLFDDPVKLRILTAGMEILLPTGSERRGLGEGTVIFEPYLSAGMFWRGTYVQSQISLELPRRAFWNDKEFGYNLYLGRDTSARPDTWTLGVEFNGANHAFAITPQIRKGLTRTGALAGAFGVHIPVARRDELRVRYVSYLLWDYLEPVIPRR